MCLTAQKPQHYLQVYWNRSCWSVDNLRLETFGSLSRTKSDNTNEVFQINLT